jgi:hypothetical protein
MMKQLSFASFLCLACVIAFGIWVLLVSLFEKREVKTNLFYQDYGIEPSSMLERVGSGNIEVFFPRGEDPTYFPPEQQMTINWAQDDYFRVADALFEFARGDTVDEWQLNLMSLSLDCPEIGLGFDHVDFHFFKNTQENGRETRIERIVNIDPQNKDVFITENEYYPKLFNWSSIDWRTNIISAEEALQKAESAGGKEKRLSVKNACYVWLSLKQGIGWWNKKWWWGVHYSRMDNEGRWVELFSIDINPYTGEARP